LGGYSLFFGHPCGRTVGELQGTLREVGSERESVLSVGRATCKNPSGKAPEGGGTSLNPGARKSSRDPLLEEAVGPSQGLAVGVSLGKIVGESEISSVGVKLGKVVGESEGSIVGE